jgi:hypothetical protein
MQIRELSSLLFWGAFFAIVAFFGTKSTWYDTWKTPEQIDFWVAAGTLLLAIFTAASVGITARVLNDETVRHQQGFAPIVKIDVPLHYPSSNPGLTLLNVGKGAAINIVINVDVTYCVEEIEDLGPTPDGRGKNFKYTNGPAKSYKRQRFVSALADGASGLPGASAVLKDLDLGEIDFKNSATTFKSVIRYFDMFGNRYETRYEDGSTTAFRWVPPVHLRSR